ncbi:MAG: endolytic transglycosylase MltG [Phototrophicales bacterium]|nr:MAG: endolytic transglycosylase MltG [Phototrophicales bacterium]
MESRNRFADITPAILLPIVLSLCLICGLIAVVTLFLFPSRTNPLESLYLQAYIRLNNDELHQAIGTDSTPRRFEVLPGSTANDIGIKLVTEGFISNGTLFARYAQYKNLDDDFVPGVFYLNETMDIPTILEVLTDPTPTTIRFTIRENMRIEEIAEQIDATPQLAFTGNDFLSLVRAGAPIPEDFRIAYGIPLGQSLEGFMYPATYEVPVAMPVEEFVEMLLSRFEQAITSDIVIAAAERGKTIYQIVIIASIVEREAVLDEERTLIASVYWNRLENNMRLEADPTVQYQLANNRQDGIWWPPITPLDYTTAEGPYNTYLNHGLPPGPIVSPASRSIIAAAKPAETDYLYFQTSCEGGGKHVFFRTFAEHQAYFELRQAGC